MRDIQFSRPVLIALLGAVLAGGYLFYSSTQNEGEVVPPTPAPTGPSGATGGTGGTGKTGATGPVDSAAEARRRRRALLVKRAKKAGMPLDVYVAKLRRKEVVIFFWEPRAKDDQRVNEALQELKKVRKHMVVFRDRISNKSDYDGIAKAAEIDQTPGLVMLYRSKADSWQGYIDSGTLNERLTRLSGHYAPAPSGGRSNQGVF